MAKTLGIHLLLPKRAYPNTALDESYVNNGILNLEFNNMVAMESKRPIPSSYKPHTSGSVALGNGVSAQWLLVYGVGGGAYRLLFEEDGTYVRLQLFSSYIPAQMSNMAQIAAQFAPVS